MKKILLTLFIFSLISWHSYGQDLITDGNFPANFSGWTTVGNAWHIGSLSCFFSSPAYAFVGNSDGTGAINVSGYLAQSVTFPSNPYSATLSFYYSIATSETTTSNIYDSLEVFFYDNIHTFPVIVKLSNLDHTGSTLSCNPYVLYTHNITGSEMAQLAGLTVQLRFKAGNNTYNPTKFNIDNVSLICVVCTPAQPGTIYGSAAVCNSSTHTYSISAVSGASDYTWNLPSGWTGSSTSTSITATAGSAGGTISVTANDTCGSSPVKTLAVTVDQALPAQPGSISGSPNVCNYSSGTYSINPVPGASNYTWTYPFGWTGTNSTTTSISVTANNSNGAITVTANNGCGSSTPQSLPVFADQLLSQPGNITGNQNVCKGTVETYNINAVPGALTYSWILPNGWTGSSTTETITTTVGNYGGILYVSAINSCGTSDAQVFSTTVNAADTNVTVSGLSLSAYASPADYKWLTCPGMQIITGETSQAYYPMQSGSYAVIVTQNNCVDTSFCHQITITGLSDTEYPSNIDIYPNPTDGLLTIQNTGLVNGNYKIIISNTLGQILIEKNINISDKSADYQIDINELSSGIYFLTINSALLNMVYKVQKL